MSAELLRPSPYSPPSWYDDVEVDAVTGECLASTWLKDPSNSIMHEEEGTKTVALAREVGAQRTMLACPTCSCLLLVAVGRARF